MVRFLVGLTALASIAFADITFNCVGYPSTLNGGFGVSVNGAVTKLSTNETNFPVWSAAVPGTTSDVQYSYVELNAAGATVKSETFTRHLNQTTDTHTPNEFFERPITNFEEVRLPYTYLATYPSKSKAFKEDQIITIHLTAPQAFVDAMNSKPEQETEVRVGFRFINAKNIYSQTNITLQTSGKSSKEFAKQSYKISFDTDYNQTFFSRPNLKLRSVATEPTFLREKLYIDMLNSVGVPTQQVSYARLYINSEPYGLFLMVDDIKKSFAKQTVHGGDKNVVIGSLIQSNAPSLDVQADLVFKGPTSASYNPDVYISQSLGNNIITEPLGQLIAFMQDIQAFDATNPDGVKYWSDRLDLDGFLRNMALEYLMGAFDNYWSAGSNYFLYFNPTLGTSGKWQWLPTDFDGTFGNGASIDTKASYKVFSDFKIDHPLVSKLIVNNTAINGLFNQILKEIVSTAFKPEAMNKRIDYLHSMISLDAQWDYSLTRHSPGKNLNFTFEDFNNNINNITKEMSGALKPWVEERANAVAAELAFTIPAGTADRVAPPPRGNGKDDDDEDGEGGDGTSNANVLSAAGMGLLTLLASSLMFFA
ncbi:hypothetical protein BGZ76_010902 [Entomortierella beljakovae]|nr:hypothetical protein BGZ76_010902 [Entomortierella beljakovae]